MIDEESTFNPFSPGVVKPAKKVLSKRRHEGYMLVDNRSGPGVPDAVLKQQGLPAGYGKGLFESATVTCSHCQRVIVLNPDRSRERAYCRRCDHYICDTCGIKYALDKICLTFIEIADRVYDAGAVGKEVKVLNPDTKDQLIVIP